MFTTITRNLGVTFFPRDEIYQNPFENDTILYKKITPDCNTICDTNWSVFYSQSTYIHYVDGTDVLLATL